MYYRVINAEACIYDSEQADDEDEDEKTGEGKEQNSADGESEADEHRASVANESKVRESFVYVAARHFSSRALSSMVGVSVSHNAQHGLQGIVCAEVTHIAKHPNADRLKVCQLDAGSTSIQVKQPAHLSLAVMQAACSSGGEGRGVSSHAGGHQCPECHGRDADGSGGEDRDQTHVPSPMCRHHWFGLVF